MKKNFIILLFLALSQISFNIHAKDNSQHNSHSASSHSTHDSKSDHARKKGPISSSDAYEKLITGHKRFMSMKYKKDGKGMSERKKLANGQAPYAIVLSCADSRVPPELIFDQGLGEIFVVRAAGEALDASTIASIEYAVSHLGSNLIVVMGHESCGAVKAALGTLNGEDAGSEWLNKLVKDIHPRVKKFSGLPQSEGAIVESWSNVQGIALDLLDRSKIISEAVKTGDVEIKKAMYHLGNGKVEWRD